MSSVEYNNTESILETAIIDNDVHVKLQEVIIKLKTVEQERDAVTKEKQELHDNFNTQRAKMQKLYIQNEDNLTLVKSERLQLEEENKRLNKELSDSKSELFIAGILKENEVEEEKRRAQVEIASLNRLVDETVEVSSSSQIEVKKLQMAIQALQNQLAKLSTDKEKDSSLLVPGNVLSATKSLAMKVVSHLGSDSDKSAENLEDSMKKAKEDADVIRSLVVPLENQISDLIEKLKTTEEKLKTYEAKKPNDGSPKSTTSSVDGFSPSRSTACDMCANYETQLQSHQLQAKQLQKQIEVMEANMEKFKEDLEREKQFRKEIEDKWNEKKEEQKLLITHIKNETVLSSEEINDLQKAFVNLKNEAKERMKELRFDRVKINAEMLALRKQNENLVGKHSAHSEQLRNETINFPNNVDDLQVLLLDMREKLISAKVAEEAAEEEAKILRSEYQNFMDQMEAEQYGHNLFETNAREQLDSMEKDLMRFKSSCERLSLSDKTHKLEKSSLQQSLNELLAENKKKGDTISELRTCVASLQQELDSSEMVQKDFVRLSQSLQIELEKIRGADTEVRWQHEEDVVECSGCKTVFVSNKKKVHCRHCGKVFCQSCLPHAMPSGPNQRPSRVCEVCHTLLNRDTAPYFSQKPPHSSD